MSRDLRNVQQQQENLGKEVDYLYDKEEQEVNFFPCTKQGDEPIIHNSQKVKEEKSEIQVLVYQDPRLWPGCINQDAENLSYSKKQALMQLPEVVNWPKFSDIGEYDHM
ncbi:hypothetical protein O181_115828 [Austropuccinia psidii MF-1]|uniref:Uncharacterized protein n=1 Tax=Austropuccinia psidii MF-1 TaxID=1389203 RepID=A0A9Q3K762_9BASI|nr:hypothetical protein [Austropuccinia psidii MF-1]